MRKLNPKELEKIKPTAFSDEEIVAWSWYYCIIYGEMKNATRTGGFIGSISAGGSYCRYHSEEELGMHLTLDKREPRV